MGGGGSSRNAAILLLDACVNLRKSSPLLHKTGFRVYHGAGASAESDGDLRRTLVVHHMAERTFYGLIQSAAESTSDYGANRRLPSFVGYIVL